MKKAFFALLAVSAVHAQFPVASFAPEAPQANGHFGFSCDVSGTDVIVSGHSLPDHSAAYIF
jgi:hypothetical protein